jgi:hypothetical protein
MGTQATLLLCAAFAVAGIAVVALFVLVQQGRDAAGWSALVAACLVDAALLGFTSHVVGVIFLLLALGTAVAGVISGALDRWDRP